MAADPSLVEPLEDRGLLQILEPNTWVDQEMTEQLATVVVDLLTAGAFDDLPEIHEGSFQELSYSRMGYGADVPLTDMLVEELQGRGLARPTEDGVSVPLHPTVRTTILVALAQLARVAGTRHSLNIHPATMNVTAIRHLISVLARDPMPSSGHVVALDLEAVSRDLDIVPLDEVLAFRADRFESHRAYRRDLHRFMLELAEFDNPEQREQSLIERREQLADEASSLRSHARRSFKKNLASWSMGVAGAAWSVAAGDPLGVILAGIGLGASAVPMPKPPATVYSYVFQIERRLGR